MIILPLMQTKNFIYLIGILVMVSSMTACSTIKTIGVSTQSIGKSIKKSIATSVKRNDNSSIAKEEPIEFLDHISVKPGRIYLSKASDSIEAEPSSGLSRGDNYEKMPDNLSDVEKANWLQLKYSIKMDVAVESINNIPLLQKIDEWWGTPYCLGGSSKGCIDCSYFTLDVMSSIYHINLRRTAAEQYEQATKIDWSELKEGDLIFFKTEGRRNITHVGIYMTNNKFAHASTSQGVTISDLADPYWKKRLYSLGRVASNY